jgi:hypothetical protein
VYIAGSSSATWGAPNESYNGGWDAYAAKLDANGALQWNSFLGSAGGDAGSGIVLRLTLVFITGSSDATWGASPKRAYSAGTDAFVTKLNSVGAFQWHTFLGGAGADDGRGIAMDTTNGLVYVVGNSDATWGAPTLNYNSATDVSVAMLDLNGNLQTNFFVGGDGSDDGNALAADAWNVYLAGASNYTWGSSGANPSSWDGWVARIQMRYQIALPFVIKNP